MLSPIRLKHRELIREMISIYRMANGVISKNKKLDRETVVQTLYALKKKPIERLDFALFRGQKIT